MLNFILNNCILDYIILVMFYINSILTLLLDLRCQRKDFKKVFLYDNIKVIKLSIMIIEIIVFITILGILSIHANIIRAIFYFIIPSIFLIINIFKIYKDKQSLSIDDKYSVLYSMIIYILFFSSNATLVYYKTFSTLSYSIKEVLLIIYLLVKIILFIFFFLTNMAILVSNIKKLKLFKLKVKTRYKSRLFIFKDYNFYFYNRYKLKISLIADILIYAFLCIPIFIFNLTHVCLIKIYNNLLSLKRNAVKSLNNFNINSNKIIKKITSISIIISFSIVRIIMIVNPSLFSNNITQIYDFLSTAILIPFIYDIIKSK